MHKLKIAIYLLLVLSVSSCANQKVIPSLNQPEVMAWGNLSGIRIDGQLMPFKTSLRMVHPDWSKFTETAKEQQQQRTRYSRTGNTQTITGFLEPLSFKEVISDSNANMATINVRFTAEADTHIAGAFFYIELRGADYAGCKIQLINPAPALEGDLSLAELKPDSQHVYLRTSASGARFFAPQRQLEVTFAQPTEISVRGDSPQSDIQVYITVISSGVRKDQTAQNTFTLKASGLVDRNPVQLVLDATRPGRAFAGLGGNFRIQNPKVDSLVIQYNLDNLRVAWGRVEMPWYFWHPDENIDPIAAAKAGKLNPHVHAAMDIARNLAQRGIPVIVSDWGTPAWAIIGDPRDAFRPQPGGLRGYPLNPDKMEKIYASIAAYIIYLKENYGVEAAMFSFNESDLGIYVRMTGKEHADFIKGLGAYLASKGLATRLLLGDTSDARPIDFIKPAMADADAVRWIGAVSFHSWRGCTDEKLTQWRDAAVQLNVPLLVGEGSTDAAAWHYPDIFKKPSFALDEINLYTRICAISQPLSILQWQLTSDYSILVGGGVFGNDKEPLQPTQRFWNLKQLASTPAGSSVLPITSDRSDVTCAAFSDTANGVYTVHIVSNNAARPATLTGLPGDLKQLRIYVTDSVSGMMEGKRVPVNKGKAKFKLHAASFTTLMSVR